MKKKIILRILLFLDITLFLVFVFYKSYLLLFETDFTYSNINNIKKIQLLEKRSDLSFAVLGNIKNSIDVFDKQIINKINSDGNLNFVISTGNSLIDGEEDKYRLLDKSLKKIIIPTLIGVGDNEVSDGGSIRFYSHYGPFYYSFSTADCYFIFLDSTDYSSVAWQKDWLLKELKNSETFKFRFVIMNKSPFKVQDNKISDIQNKYIKDESYSSFLTENFTDYKVTAVFSSGAEIFQHKKINNVEYFITGAAGGGLIINNEDSFYHYLKVNINSDNVSYTVVKQETPLNLSFYLVLKNFWFYIHAIFYLNFFNFLLILCLLIFVALLVNKFVYNPIDYYNDLDDPSEDIKKSLNIAMFTNNYLPFIGGVPISIVRLTKGLIARGHKVIIFAPEYPKQKTTDVKYIIRCRLLMLYKSKTFNFHIANIFSRKIEKEFVKYNFDVIHVHHPFWMGSKGLELGKKYGLPVVLTYHTRLEKYAHNLPFFKKSFKNLLSHKLIKIFSQKCDAVIAPTNSAKKYLENIGVSRQKIVMPTGIDFDYFQYSDLKQIEDIRKKYRPSDGLLLCSVSRLSKEKRLTFLLEGIKYVKLYVKTPFKCIIIGDGPEKEILLNIIKKEGLTDTVELVGSMDPERVCMYYTASDIFVFSSQSETQGMVLLEAMAGGCPVVAVRSSGVNDVIINGYNGFKTKADMNLWAEKLIYLMENPKILEEISLNARDFSNKFSLDQMAKITVEVYNAALHHKKIYLRKAESVLLPSNKKKIKTYNGVIKSEKNNRSI